MEEIIPTADKTELFMREVYLHASESKDPSSKVGAVIIRGDTPISTGFNGFPRKVKDFKSRYENKEVKYMLVAHAEANAIYSAARNGISTNGATLYTNAMPCNNCMIAIIQAGIKNVFIHKQYPPLSHSEKWVEAMKYSRLMAEEAGVEIVEFDKHLGIAARVGGKSIIV